jgi:dTDP-4-dehydrorhamnose reductase
MTRILVTGASGLLGFHFAWQVSQKAEVIGITHSQELVNTPFQSVKIDLSQPGMGEKIITQYKPDVLVHCAALANVDACDLQPELADRMNAVLPEELAVAAEKKDIRMVHISTDAVFDGSKGNYREDDEPNPLSTYARTKLKGEKAVLQACPDAIVARVNFFGWSMSGRRSLAEWFVSNLTAGRVVNGFIDIFFCPLEVTQLCEFLQMMLEKDLKGLFHVVSSESISKYAFGVKLAEAFGLESKLIKPVSWKDGGLLAARSPMLTLDTEKLTKALGMTMPDIQDGIDRFHQQYETLWPLKMRNTLTS